MKKNDRRLADLLKEIQSSDLNLEKELRSVRKKPEFIEAARTLAAIMPPAENSSDLESFEVLDTEEALESIVFRVGRPVLTILRNEAQIDLEEADSVVWRAKLDSAKARLSRAIKSVGRVELINHVQALDWVGTAWLVAKDIVVTNRHVAEVFARSNGAGFVFRQGADGNIVSSHIDLLEEFTRTEELIFKLTEIIHIEPEPGPDMAFFRVQTSNGINQLPPPIDLAKNIPDNPFDVAVIGYPAKDSRVPDQALMEKIFGSVYDKKRLAPGQVTMVKPDRILHNCSTLGGCSGSVVLDLSTGEAVGLHFSGRYLESNFAVPSALVAERLVKLETGISLPAAKPVKEVLSNVTESIKINIPLTIIMDSTGRPTISIEGQPIRPGEGDTEDEDEFVPELKPEDYNDREGYLSNFLGEGFDIKLPVITDEKKKKDVLSYKNDGKDDNVLRYQHFSVMMSKSRRYCFFSAVNINGAKSRKSPRVGWRRDPRIPSEAQIMNECYGNPPKFSRGHMTRREDPVWGKEIDALQGNSDSMCVTNTVPQMQSFNAPIWLALEDHALNNARADNMSISVFTGPIMKSDDPVMFGVKIPVTFWKIIAFIHDETGKLCATGYKMSQTKQLPDAEFVFGAFGSAQTSIKWIEKQTGLSFGNLSASDPLNDDNESLSDIGRSITDIREVKYV